MFLAALETWRVPRLKVGPPRSVEVGRNDAGAVGRRHPPSERPSHHAPVDTPFRGSGSTVAAENPGTPAERICLAAGFLFALGKVEEATEKLGAMQDESLRPLVVLEDGTPVPMGLVAGSVRQRVDEVMHALGQGVRGLAK
jgi:hypothetical protein